MFSIKNILPCLECQPHDMSTGHQYLPYSSLNVLLLHPRYHPFQEVRMLYELYEMHVTKLREELGLCTQDMSKHKTYQRDGSLAIITSTRRPDCSLCRRGC